MVCPTPSFATIVCEANFEKESGTIAFLRNYTLYKGLVTVDPIFNQSHLPTLNLSNEMYGVTVMSGLRTCKSGDRMLFKVSCDRFVIEHDQDCMILAGEGLRYNSSIEW